MQSFLNAVKMVIIDKKSDILPHFSWFAGKRGSSVVRHLPLVLEVPGSIPARGEKISVSEHAFSSVICRDDAR